MVKLSSARWRRSTPQKMVKKFTDALLGDPNLRAKIESIVCFGSAARPRDFIEGLSDIDVLVLVRRKSEHLTDRVRSVASSTDHRICSTVLSKAEFLRMLNAGSPGALLMLRGLPFLDSGAFSTARNANFKPTERTIGTLINHAFCALCIALNDYVSGFDLLESVNSAYHCIRHALRAVIVKRTGELAESNEEIAERLQDPKLRKIFDEFDAARRDFEKLASGARGRRTRDPSDAFKDGLGKLLLRAEKIAAESCEMCLEKKPKSLDELLTKARHLGGEMIDFSWRWREMVWELTIEREGKTVLLT